MRIKLTFCVLIVSVCSLNSSENSKALTQGIDFVNAVNHVHRIRDFSKKYLKSSNEHTLSEEVSPFTGSDDVLTRAEEVLASGLGDDPRFNVSRTCLNHTELFLKALMNKKQWALRMIDAMGKPGSAILNGQMIWPGSFDECVAVQAEVHKSTGITHPYQGKYCFTRFPLNTPGFNPGIPVAISIGICFPSSCSQADAEALAVTVLSLLPGVNITTLQSPSATCQENHLELDTKAIVVIIFCSIFIAIIASATAYDIIIAFFLQQSNTFSNEKHVSHHLYGSLSSNIENGHLADETAPLLQNGVSSHNGIVSHRQSELHTPHQKNEVEISKYEPGLFGRALLSFSVYTNAPKIFNTSQPKGTLTAVNGIRFISMTWVILGHTYAFGLTYAENIAMFYGDMIKRWTFNAIDNATFSVDTFFVLSGLLVSYLSLKEMKKRGGALKFKWGMYYFHRFWRLTPPYMLWLMVYVTTWKYWSSGPIWMQQGVEKNQCESWWQNLLYINNLFGMENTCFGWAWYLANDMQFFVISPVLLVPLYYSPLWGSVSCLAFILLNFITAGTISSHYGLDASALTDTDQADYMDKLYVKPWCRIGPYIVGFYVGYLLYKTECKIKMSKIINAIGWIIATTLALLVLYGTYSSDGTPTMSLGVAALYNATSRTVWGVAVAWVIFACATGYGGPVNSILSWKAIIPLSRLTYCAYLVHPVVMYTYYLGRKTLMYWNDIEVSYLFLGHTCIAYAAAFILSLAFESPMMGLEKVLLGRGKNS